MAWMAGSIGAILAVRLLGCTRTCRMILSSLTVRLNQANRTVCTDRGQTGAAVAHEHRLGSSSPGRDRRKRDLREGLRGTEWLEAIMAGVVVAMAVAVFLGGVVMGVIAVIAIAVRREDRRCTLAVEAPDRLSRNARRLTGVARRDLDAEFLRPAGQLVR
jgi:hypothetical protein